MEFDEALREAMGDMTQEELEALSGVAQTSISKYLNRASRPTLTNLDRLERALPRLRDLRTRAVA